MASLPPQPIHLPQSFGSNRRYLPRKRSSPFPTHRILAQAAQRRSIDDVLHRDYYEILGVGIDASYEEIRKAYRSLQKIHHPDVAGPEVLMSSSILHPILAIFGMGHAMTLLLNEAYKTLTSQELHRVSKSSGRSRKMYSYTGSPYSRWNGPDREDAIFVDENSCIGCRECVFHASRTFAMDDSCGSARVTTQWGDPDSEIKVAIDACPVNCIHNVEREDLPILEYLMRPQPRASNGVFGGGWERPSDVFMAARTFKRKMEATSNSNNSGSWREETPAQRKARIDADLKMRAGAFWWLWTWGSQQSGSTPSGKKADDKSGWFGLFGRSCSSDLLRLPIQAQEASKVIEVVQDWAVTFASSSELPLPLPFRADPLPNGVQLTLITAERGVVQPKGSLVVTIAEEEGGTLLLVKREGVTGTGALPGERTIIGHLKGLVKGRDQFYSSYHIPRVHQSS